MSENDRAFLTTSSLHIVDQMLLGERDQFYDRNHLTDSSLLQVDQNLLGVRDHQGFSELFQLIANPIHNLVFIQ